MANDDDEEMPEACETAGAAGEEGKQLSTMTGEREEEEKPALTGSALVHDVLRTVASAEAERVKRIAKRDRELAAVKLSADDVSLLSTELEMDAKAADRLLRQHGGDVRAALRSGLALGT
jgi:NACalpha-BTF3-like transcription factor